MEVLVAYDVATDDAEGRRRLRRVAKVCEAYGQRVQRSVFECVVNEAQLELLKHRLLLEMDLNRDSLRIYRLREPRDRYLYVVGSRPAFDLREPLAF
jgi:CRISPR-associated protein Cas2